MNEQDSYSVTLSRVREVFGRETLMSMQTPQKNVFNRLMNRELQYANGKPLTLDQIDGIKQLVTEELWHPELTKQSAQFSATTKTSSATSASNSAAPNQSESRNNTSTPSR